MQLYEYRTINEVSLFDYLNKVIEASKEGFVLSDTNEYFPQNLFSIYTVTMLKPYGEVKEKENKQVQLEPDLEVKPAAKKTTKKVVE